MGKRRTKIELLPEVHRNKIDFWIDEDVHLTCILKVLKYYGIHLSRTTLTKYRQERMQD